MRLRVRMFGVKSLKEKRSLMRRLLNDIRKKYNVSISEVDLNDSKVYMDLAVAMVSKDSSLIDRVFDSVVNYIEIYGGMELEDVEREVW